MCLIGLTKFEKLLGFGKIFLLNWANWKVRFEYLHHYSLSLKVWKRQKQGETVEECLDLVQFIYFDHLKCFILVLINTWNRIYFTWKNDSVVNKQTSAIPRTTQENFSKIGWQKCHKIHKSLLLLESFRSIMDVWTFLLKIWK